MTAKFLPHACDPSTDRRSIVTDGRQQPHVPTRHAKPQPRQGMEEMGNARAKEHFEAGVPAGYPVPREHATVREREKWIRDKYEHRRFVSTAPRAAQKKAEEEPSRSR